MLAFWMQRFYKHHRRQALSGLGLLSRPKSMLFALAALAPLCGCATVSVYQPTSAEVSLTAEQSQLHKASDDYCKDARHKGLATGETSIGNIANMLSGKDPTANAYWRKIGADRSAPASVMSRIRADMTDSAKGLTGLNTMARSLLGSKGAKPTKDDVTEFELALIHARQARESLSDALMQVNKRTDREYQIVTELTPLDQALDQARATADELAAARDAAKTA